MLSRVIMDSDCGCYISGIIRMFINEYVVLNNINSMEIKIVMFDNV